jgi:hypothetical protein
VNAGEALRAARLDTEELRGFIHPVDPDRVTLRPAPSWMTRMWGKATGALTVGRRVFVRPDVLAGDPDALGRLVVHELVHVRQWSDYGPLSFLLRYLRRYLGGVLRGLGHRDSYQSNPYEVEAREAVERFGITV